MVAEAEYIAPAKSPNAKEIGKKLKLTELLALLVLVLALVMGVLKAIGIQTSHLLDITIEQQIGGEMTTQ